MQNLYKILKFPARTDIFCLACLWLLVVVALGTIAQKEIGLYLAHKKYFSSIFWWLFDIIPVPSAGVTIAFIFIGLMVKTLSEKWTKQNIGTLIVHIGVLLLIGGGFVTAKFSKEGNMVLAVGGESNYVASYHDIELAISDVTDGIEKDVVVFSDKILQTGNILSAKNLDFKIKVIKFCRNCAISLKDDKKLPMPDRIVLQDAELERIEEENVSGIRYEISGIGDEQDKTYLAFENIPVKSRIKIEDKIYKISLRHSREYLPFSLKLLNFEKKTHAATTMAKSYKSEVLLQDGDIKWHSVIKMNNPLRYKGYSFYQSSVLTVNGEDMSVLAVVKNVGRLFPYISSIIICIGLLIHLFIRLPNLMVRAKNILLIFSLLGVSFTNSALANNDNTSFNYDNIAKLPILHEGRIKPLDTVARIWLTSLYGKEKLADMTAIEWLTKLILNPEGARRLEVFNITNPEVVDAIRLDWKLKHKYSFDEVFPAVTLNMRDIMKLYMVDRKELSLSQRQLIDLVSKISLYVDISRSLNFTPPDIDRSKDKNTKPNMENVLKTGRSVMFRILPAQWGEDENWYSPWEIIQAGQSSPKTAKLVIKLQELSNSYKKNKSQEFNKISNEILDYSWQIAKTKFRPDAIKLEVIYNKLSLFKNSLYLYVISFVFILLYFAGFKKYTYFISLLFSVFAAILHFLGIGARMYIMARPPVSTLYESILFVGIIAVIFALLLEKRNRDARGIFMASIIGSILQFIGIKYAVDGDTMGMLVAVLDTNFWLATHVVTITIGYGFCVLASMLGHLYLVQKIINSKNKVANNNLFRNMLAITLIALLFAVLGTILGGIWADQSWGRFWGWDPKENGALLICLWLILLLHGVIAKLLTPIYFAVGMVLTNVVVALAWFGVNLLGVGLHSYGFTENIADNLAIFCTIEILFASSALAIISYKKDKKNA